MLKRLEVFLIAAVFLLMSAVVLIIYSKQREQEFKDHNALIQKASVNGAAYAISLQLKNKQRHVRLFSEEYANLFSHLNFFPQDSKTEDDIKTRLSQRFPDFFTFTISDRAGKPRLFDIESLVGDACKHDLSNFAKKIKSRNNNKSLVNDIFIHPQPFQYHYDVMAPLYTNGNGADVFFISFYLKEIIDILNTHQVPGNNLILLRKSDPALIEVTSKGVRDKISRAIRLTKEELDRVKESKNIVGTDWRLVNLPDAGYQEQYQRGLWKEAIIILLIESLTIFLLILVLIKLSNRKTQEKTA